MSARNIASRHNRVIVALTFHPLQIIDNCDCSAGSVPARIYKVRGDDCTLKHQRRPARTLTTCRQLSRRPRPRPASIPLRQKTAPVNLANDITLSNFLVHADNEAIAQRRLLRTCPLTPTFVIEQWPCWLPNPRSPRPWVPLHIKTHRLPSATTPTTTEHMAVLPNPSFPTLLECPTQ